MMAKAAGVEPDLALRGGTAATRVLGHISDALEAGNETAKNAALQKAQQKLRAIDSRKHGKLVQSLQGRLLAMQGRGDTTNPQTRLSASVSPYPSQGIQVAGLPQFPAQDYRRPPTTEAPWGFGKLPLRSGQTLPGPLVDPRFDNLPFEEQKKILLELRLKNEIDDKLYDWYETYGLNPDIKIPPMPPINIEE